MAISIASDLIDQFVQSAHNAFATIEQIPANSECLNISLSKAIEEDDLVLFSPPDELNRELFSLFESNNKIITNPSNDHLKEITTGITDAFCGIASTGSVCITISNSLSVPVSMLTRKHIVVVDSKTIVPMPRNIFDESYLEGKGLKRSFTIITGPSATADMGPLVRGVHGPGKLHIIVLE